MRLSSPHALRITAFLGFAAVALGAFGAHRLHDRFARLPEAREWWEKAVLYHFIHTLVMLLLAGQRPFRAGPWYLFAFGILIFSGTLYIMALTDLRWLGAVTPLGGICLLGGWLWIGVVGAREASGPA